jgi:general secretion pathway protein C
MASIMAARFFALLVWAAVAASLAYWGLRWLAPPVAVPAHASAVGMDSGIRGDVARLLSGATKVQAGPQTDPSLQATMGARIKVLGVVAPRDAGHQGVALLSLDGQPPKAVRIGGAVEGDWVLQGITQRVARIGPADGAPGVELGLPQLPMPATGALPPATGVSTRPSTLPPGGNVARPAAAELANAMPGNAIEDPSPAASMASGRLASPEGR